MAANSQIASGFNGKDWPFSARRATAQGPSLQVNLNSLQVPMFNQRKSSLPIISSLVSENDESDKCDYDEFTSEDLLTAARIGKLSKEGTFKQVNYVFLFSLHFLKKINFLTHDH